MVKECDGRIVTKAQLLLLTEQYIDEQLAAMTRLGTPADVAPAKRAALIASIAEIPAASHGIRL